MEATDQTGKKKPEKIKLTEINQYLTCYLCKGYLIDATTISECLHSFCRCCIIKFLQENSYCPVCEVIINKAKPNLKLDKTLQDIVYKLVPELFLKEMTRRKRFYQQHPLVAAKVSPEERGEDTERTIFNPQDFISLSIEYVRDDSTPGAIRLPDVIIENDKNVSPEEAQESVMKRYLQCPGMCRVDVLKKFVTNKYNVDTNRFYIDVLYKRVPLPDHYTLIDIAYIYSWKRNEPMKLFFRITDINKVSERFDFFDASKPTLDLITQLPAKSRNSNSSKRRESISQKKNASKIVKEPSQEIPKICDKSENSVDKKLEVNTSETVTVTVKNYSEESATVVKSDETSECGQKIEKSVIASDNKEEIKKVENKVLIKPDIVQQLKTKLQNDKAKGYTNITLNRSNNVEIITKIQPVSNKDGQPIGHHIVRQTIKKTTQLPATPLVPNTFNVSKSTKKPSNNTIQGKEHSMEIKTEPMIYSEKSLEIDEEKSRFLNSIELTARKKDIEKPPEPHKQTGGQKRKNPSPVKHDKTNKKARIERKTPMKIILHEKQQPPDQKRDSGLQSFIDSCKINIPSSLSITIKEGTDTSRAPTLIPPVKNYIEILKLPDDNSVDSKEKLTDVNKESVYTFCDSDSEQKVDQDLSEIAKSLTEKIPISTTVSQIVGPKQQFAIPVKANASKKIPPIQPSPVPEVAKAVNASKENLVKLSPRSPQTFQKIFEESIKKPDSPQNTGPDVNNENSASNNNNNKRNILEIASQLYKKNKLEQEKNQLEVKTEEVSLPKVPIPRLRNQQPLKPSQKVDDRSIPQIVANMHSTSLGLNYTVSVGAKSPTKPTKSNGVVSPIKADPKPDTKSPLTELKVPSPLLSSPKQSDLPSSSSRPASAARIASPVGCNSPKHSPKSSPLVKHMYAPNPAVTPLPPTYALKPACPLNKFSHLSPKLPSPSAKPAPNAAASPTPGTTSPKRTNSSPKPADSGSGSPKSVKKSPSKSSSAKAGSSQNVPLSPSEILEKYNIQNLAQLTASLNFNATNFGLNPANQLAAFQHAMLLKHIEMQNRQNWLNINQGPLLQYEKYLASLNGAQNHLLGNINEN